MSAPPDPAGAAASAAAHDRRVAEDLACLCLPAENWPATRLGPDGLSMTDVLVVGAGVCGLAVAFGLRNEGIRTLRHIDRAPAGAEGPWVTFGRMRTLRSSKTLIGPAMGIPSLTFRAWHEARFGAAAFDALDKIPNRMWMDYLVWYREILGLPVENGVAVTRLDPAADHVRASLTHPDGRTETHYARHVVLATGMGGAGQCFVPAVISPDLWPDRAAHGAEDIDFARLAGAHVTVLGAGPSAFDNAAAALEAGAGHVQMLLRRPALPQINKGRGSAYPGFITGYPALPDAERWRLFRYFYDWPAPPPCTSIERVLVHGDRFRIRFGTGLAAARRGDTRVRLDLADGSREDTDFLICATGFRAGLVAAPEIGHLADRVTLWRDRLPADTPGLALLGGAPYVGDRFELLERTPGACPGAERILFFNHGASASHGPVAGGIPGASVAAGLVVRGLAGALMREDIAHVHARLEAFDEPELEGTPFHQPAPPP